MPINPFIQAHMPQQSRRLKLIMKRALFLLPFREKITLGKLGFAFRFSDFNSCIFCTSLSMCIFCTYHLILVDKLIRIAPSALALLAGHIPSVADCAFPQVYSCCESLSEPCHSSSLVTQKFSYMSLKLLSPIK